MTTKETIDQLQEIVQSTLKELSGQDWIVKPRHEKWDLHFNCQLGNFKRQTQDLDLMDSIDDLSKMATAAAESMYYIYERRKARGLV